MLPVGLTAAKVQAATIELFISQTVDVAGVIGAEVRLDGLGIRGDTEAEALAAQTTGERHNFY